VVKNIAAGGEVAQKTSRQRRCDHFFFPLKIWYDVRDGERGSSRGGQMGVVGTVKGARRAARKQVKVLSVLGPDIRLEKRVDWEGGSTNYGNFASTEACA